ncbi:NAD-dependent epimerase/dehydratase family protein [Jhaorihella thermophila]
MIGRKLTESIVRQGHLGGREVTALDLTDVVAPTPPEGAPEGLREAADISAPDTAARLIGRRPDVIVHLAAIPSGGAEEFFEKGYAVNFDGTRFLLEAIRAEGLAEPYCPKVVFSSTIAVFGAPFPDRIGDEFICAPLTSYGAQKVMGEMLVCDYTRRGFLDGIAIRLPTICIRPGKPNLAASGFFFQHPARASGGSARQPAGGRGRPALVRLAPRGGRVHPSRGGDGPDAPRPAPGDQHAGTFGHGHRRDRGFAPGGRRKGGGADHPRAGPRDHRDRRRLAARFPPAPGARSGFPGRAQFRRDHSRAYRGRAGRRDPGERLTPGGQNRAMRFRIACAI